MTKFGPSQDQGEIGNSNLVKKAMGAFQRVGIYNQPIDEDIPQYEYAPSEKAIGVGDNNSFILVGRDRPTNLASGYGGKGHTQCGRIDLIAGLAGSECPVPKTQYRNPSFQNDAARVYISQKSDIDKDMGLAKCPQELSSKGRSAIGLKADHVRIHSRQDVKIVSGRMKIQNGGDSGELLSTGGENEVPGKIYLLAGNYANDEKLNSFNILDPISFFAANEPKVQPIPKGIKVARLFQEMMDVQSEIVQEIVDLINILTLMNLELAGHIHAPAVPPVTGPSAPLSGTCASRATQLQARQSNLAMLQQRFVTLSKTYLQVTGGDYINSNHVYVS